ncbi:DoxX family protein [Reichenbachiella versicolor]|uniref:DoxX family protein n=1 Tax=Reichenbachiella versicolor TaxID=1821036 RepID=UPI000D6E1831|nr:DoxX family protein [Reichenbachiella versicolor]
MNHIGLLLLRVSFSVMMLTHGYPKLMKLVEGKMSFLDPIGIGEVPSLILAVIGELICPVLVIVGYKTKYSALPVIATMTVATFVVHAGDALAKKELALLYLFGFIAIALLGGGKHSIDRS